MKKSLVLGMLITFSMIALFGRKAHAQFTAPAPTPAGGVETAAAATAAPAQAKTLWSFLGITPENLRKCTKHYCASPLGQFVNGMLTPVRFASGGLIPDCCAKPLTAAELAALKPGEVSPAEAAAAKIKADEAGAKARRAAVRYLATVDCHYYPEAEAALIAALRADRNECVRLEAAMALGNGCCCTKKTIEALNLVVTGEATDGNPSETSERVKLAAFASLQSCLSRGLEFPTPPETVPPPVKEPPALGKKDASAMQLASFTKRSVPTATDAERAFAQTAGLQPRTGHVPTGKRNLLDIWRHALHHQDTPELPTASAEAAHQPTPSSAAYNLRALGLTPLGAIPLQ